MENLKRLKSRKFSQTEIDSLVDQAIAHMLNKCQPREIYIFGSAVAGPFDEHSDLDFVLVFATPEEAKAAQKELYRAPPPVKHGLDMLCVDVNTFRKKSATGGVFWIAKREGRRVFPKT